MVVTFVLVEFQQLNLRAIVQINLPDLQPQMESTQVMTGEVIQQATSGEAGARSPCHPQDALLCNMELPHCGIFYPLGYSVEIITNHKAVLQAATESFGHARLSRTTETMQVRVGVSSEGGSKCPPEPTRREYNHLYSLVADANNQALLDLKTCTSFTWVTNAAVNDRTYFRYNFIEKVVYLLLGASVVTDLHAACVSKNGKGILLIGDSGAGKSTLAYGCARVGWTYTSDDTSYLINDSIVPRVIGHAQGERMALRDAAHGPHGVLRPADMEGVRMAGIGHDHNFRPVADSHS